jgi:hypothetical protein
MNAWAPPAVSPSLSAKDEEAAMSDLHLDSLEIKNFRCFEHLVIEKLGRVNLIVGKNSVGKTALLEALWLLNCDADWKIIQNILYCRNELVRYKPENARDELAPDYLVSWEQIEAVNSFFSGRPPKTLEPTTFYTGNHPASGLTASDAFVLTVASSQRSISLAKRRGYEDDVYFDKSHKKGPIADLISELGPAPQGPVFSSIFIPPLPKRDLLDYEVIAKSKDYKTVFIPVSGLTWKATCTYWDDLTLTDKEDEIISCLQVLDPGIKKINFKGENSLDRVRYPVVKSDRFDIPLPLADIGEGVLRIFALALAMSAASNGCLLIDELETGLYHRIQPDVWNSVFKLAREWNVRVFATTHSWDCVEAFQQAAAEDQNEAAMLISLQQRKTGIKAVLFDKDELKVVTQGHIEVR